MKLNSIFYIGFLVILVCFTSCKEDENQTDMPPLTINFTIDGKDTRTIDSIIGIPTNKDTVTVKVGEEVLFADKFTLNEKTSISRNWNFGDGTISSTSEGNIIHQYQSEGQYSVELCVEKFGCVSKYIEVLESKSQDKLPEIDDLPEDGDGGIVDPYSPPPDTIRPPDPPIEIVNSIGTKIAYLGQVLDKTGLETCDDYSIQSARIELLPKKKTALMGATIYSSGCGTISINLSGHKVNKTDVLELTEGKNQLSFENIDVELDTNQKYILSISTRSSKNCKTISTIPNLLNGRTCGNTISSNDILSITTNNQNCLFKIKYQY